MAVASAGPYIKQVYTWSMEYVRTGKKVVEAMMTEQD